MSKRILEPYERDFVKILAKGMKIRMEQFKNEADLKKSSRS